MTTWKRGIRLNNPGNIERGKDDWLGMASEQPDKRLIRFSDPAYGLRAMARVLKNYQRIHGLRNISQIIGRYAPSPENPTDKYIDFVCRATGYTADERIDLNRRCVLAGLMQAIIRFENANQMPYSEAQIYQGISMEDNT